MGFIKYQGALLRDAAGKFIVVRISWKIFRNRSHLQHYLSQFQSAYTGTRVVFLSYDEEGRRHFTGSSSDRELIARLSAMTEAIELKEFEVYLSEEA